MYMEKEVAICVLCYRINIQLYTVGGGSLFELVSGLWDAVNNPLSTLNYSQPT